MKLRPLGPGPIAKLQRIARLSYVEAQRWLHDHADAVEAEMAEGADKAAAEAAEAVWQRENP